MSSFFNLNGSLNDLVRDLKAGAEQFAKAMSDAAESGEYAEGCCHGPKDFSFDFENLGYPRHESFELPDGSIVFRFQLPGFDESCINLSFKGDVMILKASLPERLRAEAAEGRRPFLRDIDRREYRVPAEQYNQTAVKAIFRNGILTVTIPAKEEDMSGSIKVEIVKEGN